MLSSGAVDRILLDEADEPPLDLLRSRHRAATFREAVGQGIGPPLGFVRATAPVSRFFVVRARSEHLTGRVTLRATGNVEAVVNGGGGAVLPAEPRWKAYELPLPLNRGRNVVELRWLAPQPDAPKEFERAARRLERGLYPEVLRRVRRAARLHGIVISPECCPR